MKKNKKITIILITVACVLVFTFLFYIYSKPYRIERIKLVMKSEAPVSIIVNSIKKVIIARSLSYK